MEPLKRMNLHGAAGDQTKDTETGRKRQLSDIMRAISERLVNTPSVVRKSYVHAIVVASYASGKLQRCFQKSRARAGCSRIERALGLLAR